MPTPSRRAILGSWNQTSANSPPAAGRSERCPGDRCPFWNDEQCVVAPLRADFAQNACLVTLLVGLRAKLAREEPGRGFREFHPPGLA